MRNAIETKNLTKVYKNFTAVNSLNLKVPEKSIFGLLGPNGAGKTTTIKMLTCLIQPTSGHASVGGYDVQENSELCADYYGVPVDEKHDRIEDLMELVDIKYARNKRVGQLSGGQKQKASLVASLVHRPEILFLDEPTIGLDPTTKRTLWDLIRELNDEGNTIILCSHDMHEVDMLCDNVGIINTGNLVAYDTPQGLKDSLLKEEKEEHEIKMKNTLRDISNENEVNKSTKEDIETLNLKKMSFLLKENNDSIISAIQSNPKVHGVEMAKNGRFNLRIDNFDDDAVNDVLKDIIEAGGVVKSIFTQEPSLEDVFIKATAEVNEDDRA